MSRSTDGVLYGVVSSPTATDFLDTAVTLGTQYFYKVAAVHPDGTSPDTSPQSVVPVPAGEMSLGQLRKASQQRADRLNSNFVTLSEWNANINQSLFELYDLLVTAYGEDYFIASPVSFTTASGTQRYPLPNGVLSFTDTAGSAVVAPAMYKLTGVDLGLNVSPNANGWVTLKKFNFAERNQFFAPNMNTSPYAACAMRYRIVGNNLELNPMPASSLQVQLWYVPKMTMLLKDTDITTSSISGWIEYVIVDAAIKALQKEESDVRTLMIQKQALIKRIEAAAMNRDAGMADTISDTRGEGMGGMSGMGGMW